jgi:predicted nucleic acid-binding protein
MFYVDKSVLIAALTIERETATAIDWLASHLDDGILASPWLTTEFASALARKVRLEELAVAPRNEVWTEYKRLSAHSLTLVRVEPVHFQTAADIILLPSATLRSGDALHLAVAAAYGATLATFDKQFARGATRLGYAVELIA